MEIKCPKCKTHYNIAKMAIGKSVRCKNSSCQFVFVINPPDFENKQAENMQPSHQVPNSVGSYTNISPPNKGSTFTRFFKRALDNVKFRTGF